MVIAPQLYNICRWYNVCGIWDRCDSRLECVCVVYCQMAFAWCKNRISSRSVCIGSAKLSAFRHRFEIGKLSSDAIYALLICMVLLLIAWSLHDASIVHLSAIQLCDFDHQCLSALDIFNHCDWCVLCRWAPNTEPHCVDVCN